VIHSALHAVIERQLLAVSPGKPGPVDLASCWRVHRVAQVSPAARLGLVPGDLLVTVDGRPLDVPPWQFHLDPANERRYRFQRPDGSFTEVLATGVDLGVEWVPTVERVVATWSPLDGDVLDLLPLWDAKAWEALEDLAWRRCQGVEHGPGLLARFQALRNPESPAAVLLGAALWEQGKRDAGVALIADWLARYTEPARITAIGWLYVARQEHADDRKSRAVLALRESLGRHRLDATLALLGEWADETVPSEGSLVGSQFPAHYELQPLDTDPEFADVVSFDEALADLGPGQVLVVCVLGRERGNAAYNDAVFRFVNHAYWLPEVIAGLHVIAGRADRQAEHDYWVAEDLARGDGLPVLVLLDDYARVAEKLGNPASPRLYLVDRHGTVAHEGGLDGVAVWDALWAASSGVGVKP